jgi:hypothetical protein
LCWKDYWGEIRLQSRADEEAIIQTCNEEIYIKLWQAFFQESNMTGINVVRRDFEDATEIFARSGLSPEIALNSEKPITCQPFDHIGSHPHKPQTSG